MTAAGLKRQVIVNDSDTAALLVNPRALHFFAPFMIKPESLTSVADRLGTTPSAVAYWVPQFREARLIEPVPTPEGRPRRRGKWYRSRADEFLLPMKVLLNEDNNNRSVENARRRQIDRFYDALAKAKGDNSGWGMSVSVAGGEVHLRGAVPDPHDPVRPPSRTYDGWMEMWLTRTQAGHLKSELKAVLDRYRHLPMTPRVSMYIVHLGIAPTEDR
jgi:transposase-like protein